MIEKESLARFLLPIYGQVVLQRLFASKQCRHIQNLYVSRYCITINSEVAGTGRKRGSALPC